MRWQKIIKLQRWPNELDFIPNYVSETHPSFTFLLHTTVFGPNSGGFIKFNLSRYIYIPFTLTIILLTCFRHQARAHVIFLLAFQGHTY